MKLFLFALLASFCQEIPVGYFDSIKSSGPFDVYYTQSDTPKVIVEGKEDQVKQVQANLFDETLILRMGNGKWPKLDVKVKVFSPVIEEITCSGSGSVICGDINIPGKELELEVNGSGNFVLGSVVCEDFSIKIMGSGSASVKKVSADEVELETLGSGSISINGKCNKVEAATRGSGSIKGSLKHNTIDKSILGSGTISL